jgi:hypothetical protein
MAEVKTVVEIEDRKIPLNLALIWDYDIPENVQENEGFWLWYLQRVLSRGTAEDLRTIGLGTIVKNFSKLILPPDIHTFWEWYLNLEAVKQRYGNPDTTSNSG